MGVQISRGQPILECVASEELGLLGKQIVPQGIGFESLTFRQKEKMIKTGDVVKLKGMYNPMKMTVGKVFAEQIQVLWFDRENKLNKYFFNKDLLELA